MIQQKSNSTTVYTNEEIIKYITNEQIRTRLIEVFKQSGMTQTELATKVNIKQQTIACYLAGKAMPALDTFANLCAVLDVDPAYILCLTD